MSVFVLIGTQASAFTAYVSNEKSNTVSVIDTDKFTVVNTIKVGQRPRGIELTKDGKFVLVAVGDDDTIQVIDVRTHEIVATLPSGPDPELFTQDHTGKILYVANENDNTVTIIDLERRVPLDEVQVGVEPEGMGLIVQMVRSSSLHRRRPIWRISSTPRRAGSSPTCWSMHGPVSRSSSAGQKYLLVGQRVCHMAFTPDEKYLLTTNGVSNDVSIIDVANLKVTKTIPVGRASLGYRNSPAVTFSP